MGNVGKVVWRENDHHSPPSSAEVKNVQIYITVNNGLHAVLNEA